MKNWLNWPKIWQKTKEYSNIAKKARNGLVLLILAVIFFLMASILNYYSQQEGFVKWSSPDETANYNFAKLFGQEHRLSVYENLNLYTNEVMHPRSVRSDYGEMKPVSFLGILIVYGQIVSWTSYKVLPFLTPAFGAIGIIFYYLLVSRIFGKRNAMMSAIMLTFFPVWIYFSARSMFHNILFMVMLVIGMYFAVLAGQLAEKGKYKILTIDPRTLNWRKFLYPSLTGIFLGLAIITRTSELLWLAPVFLILWLINIRRLGIIKLVLIITFILVGAFPGMYWNTVLYGSPIATGYPEMNQSLNNIAQTGTEIVKTAITHETYFQTLWKKLVDNIFHFGFHPYESIRTFVYYFIVMFYWIFWPFVLGLFLYLQDIRDWKAKNWGFILSFIIFSLILVFYYGSWEFHDNPDPKSFTIGNSYTRYWLPIYLAAIPLFSLFVIRLTRALYPYSYNVKEFGKLKLAEWKNWLMSQGYIREKIFTFGLQTVIIFWIILFSVQFVAYGSEEGLLYQIDKQKASKTEFDQIMKITEKNSAIITKYHDKLFFPERKVIVGLFDDEAMNKVYGKLIKKVPVYYYNFSFAPKTVDYLNQTKLARAGIQIKKVKKITTDFTLYKVVKYTPPPEPPKPPIKKVNKNIKVIKKKK